jgi:hypothetical protein
LRRRRDAFLRKVEAATIQDATFVGIAPSSPRHCRLEDQVPNIPIIDTRLHKSMRKRRRAAA